MNGLVEDYKKSKNSLYKLKLKSILSIFTLGLFVLFGFASIEDGDPETKLVDCNFLHPPVTTTQICKFTVYDEYLNPLDGAKIVFVIYPYEKMDDNGICNLVAKPTSVHRLTCDASGKASYTLSNTYTSNDDVIEIQVNATKSNYSGIAQKFFIHKSDPGIDVKLKLINYNKYP